MSIQISGLKEKIEEYKKRLRAIDFLIASAAIEKRNFRGSNAISLKESSDFEDSVELDFSSNDISGWIRKNSPGKNIIKLISRISDIYFSVSVFENGNLKELKLKDYSIIEAEMKRYTDNVNFADNDSIREISRDTQLEGKRADSMEITDPSTEERPYAIVRIGEKFFVARRNGIRYEPINEVRIRYDCVTTAELERLIAEKLNKENVQEMLDAYLEKKESKEHKDSVYRFRALECEKMEAISNIITELLEIPIATMEKAMNQLDWFIDMALQYRLPTNGNLQSDYKFHPCTDIVIKQKKDHK